MRERSIGGLVAAFVLLAGCERTAPPAPAPSGGGSEAPREIATPAGIPMILVPAGEFTMGDAGGDDDEKPPHRVSVGAFWIDEYEVTQEAYERIAGRNPSKAKDPKRPVERVRWIDAVRFCNLRSAREGLAPCYDLETFRCDFAADGYRLPTEAEWEYACRAGTATRYAFGDDAKDLAKYGWFKDNSGGAPHPAGEKGANPWGLRDLHGNVWEWCNDWYAEDAYASRTAVCADPRGPETGEERVLRGGSFSATAESCRSATRMSETPAFADACFGSEAYGFRCVRRVAAGVSR
ncbi:MAG: formylglycine-generating enzyme family protein [Planctomycetes bacterium]|nr:formylglycine-generating enzyme family protein [Planctomycetota bacterium]